MIKPINRDIMVLMRKALPADRSDLQSARDLLDTLNANRERCVGMAANMIGVAKAIIAVNTGLAAMVMLNPKIISHSAQSYEAEEGCLSLDGIRKTKRYEKITVEYEDMDFHRHTASYSGFAAQIIQHEIDHLFGKII
ncbi:MAG: peptide deformylase [Clostridia bacterium]|nr:peptide deformylase [Clostridia bacterium]